MHILDNITAEYLNVAEPWFSAVFSVATHVFGVLAIIQLTWTAMFWALKKNSADDVVVATIIQTLKLGFFYTLIIYAGTWIPMVLNSFIDIGQLGGTITKLDPSSVVSQGLSIAGAILKGIGMWGFVGSPIGSILGAACCIAIALCYVLIAADLTITLIETYFIIGVSTLFFAFGASRWTSPMSKRFIEETIGIGIKLMMLYLMIGVGQRLGQNWAQIAHNAANNHQILPFFGIAGAAIVFYLIVKNIPGRMARLAGCGTMINHGDAAVGAVMTTAAMGAKTIATAASGGTAAAAHAASAGMTAFQVGRHAHGAYQATQGGMKGGMAAAGKTSAGIASSMMDSFKRSMGSKTSDLHANMKGGADAMKQARMQTQPSSESTPPSSSDVGPKNTNKTSKE